MDGITFFGKVFFSIIFIIALCLCFYGATFDDHYIGMAYYAFPMIIGFFISINFIIVSIKNKKIHPLIFCYVLLIVSQFMGNYYIRYRETKLDEIGNKIEIYIENNNVESLDNDKIKNELNINTNILIINKGDYYIVMYDKEKRFFYDSRSKKIRHIIIL
jgi:hypothetical protein